MTHTRELGMRDIDSSKGDRAPKVSVVIATYNMAQYIGQAIESVLNQTYRNLDVHVVDDGSTDETREVVAALRARDSRVHYHWQANAGQTKAKNFGIRMSSGCFVAFCDADDSWTPHKLAVQMPRFDSDRVGVVYSRRAQMSADGVVLEERQSEDEDGRFYSGSITAQLFKHNFITFGTAVVRRRCLDEVGLFNERYRMGIDWDLWLRLSTQYEFAFVDEVTYIYRVWPGQMSKNWRARYEHAFKIMDDFLEENPRLLSSKAVKEAYAHCFARRGRLRAFVESEYRNGIQDAFTALRHHAFYVPAWKLLARILVLALGTNLRKLSP